MCAFVELVEAASKGRGERESQFFKNMQALRVIDSTCATVRGNCRGAQREKRKAPPEVDNSILKKRETKHK